MKKQKLSDLYPTAIRGDLKSDSTATNSAPKKPLSRIRDREPSTIIAIVVVTALAFCILGITLFIMTYKGYLQGLLQNI